MFIKGIHLSSKLSKYLSILCLLLLACYVLLARVALHYLPHYNDTISDYLSSTLDTPVSFKAISSYWEGFDPVLRVHNLTIGEENPLTIGQASLNFSFIQSLIHLQPKFDRILIEQSTLRLKQGDDGHWSFLTFNTGIDTPSTNATDNNTVLVELLSFFNGTTINIKELTASILNDKGEVKELRAPNVNVNYKDETLFASGQLLETRGDKTLLNFSLKGNGLLSHHKLTGSVFVEARSSEIFGELLSVYDWQRISIQDIEASGRAWVNFDGFSISAISGDLQVRELGWNMGGDTQAPIKNLALTYLWKDDESEQRFSINNFAFEWSGIACEPMSATILLTDTLTTVKADKAELHCFNQLVTSLNLLPEELNKRLIISAPTGYLTNIHVRLMNEIDSVEKEEARTFEFEAMLSGVSAEAYTSTPSGKNIDGYVYAKNGSGFVSFLSEDFELGFPTLFLEPWILKRAEGIVSWDVSQDEVIIASDGLRLWREHESLIYGDFILRLNDETTEDYIALSIGMQDILFPDATKFVPYHVVDSGLHDWLSDSLIAGTVHSGVYYGYGSVESISPANSFTSSIFLQSEDGVLKFDNAWPYLEKLNADITIQNGQVAISADEASISGTSLNNLDAYLPIGEPNKANFINISANSLLTKELITYWLTESPIAPQTKEIAQQLVVDNEAHVTITLNVPVSQTDDPAQHQDLQYRVTAKVVDGMISHTPSKLMFTQVNGGVEVDSTKGVNAQSISARLFDEDVNLSIKTDYQHQTNKQNATALERIKLSLTGSLGTDKIFNYFEADAPDFIQGKLNYLAELSLSNQDNQYPLLVIRSDLKGTRCLCPIPFNKELSDSQALKLSVLLKPEQSYLEGWLLSDHAPKIKAELLFSNETLTSGEFLIGNTASKAKNMNGINIAAKLETVELDAWISFLSAALEEKSVSSDGIGSSDYVVKKNDLVKQIHLDVNKLNAWGYLFHNNALVIQPVKDNWEISINGGDAKGRVVIPDKDQALTLDFETIRLREISSLDTSEKATTDENPDNDNDSLDPSNFPLLAFRTQALIVDERSIGGWQFNIVPNESGSVFKNIVGRIKDSKITGQLNWQYSDGIQSTIATLSLKGKDITPVFHAFELPVLFSSEAYESDMALVWPASPTDFSLAQLSGNISLSFEEGFLKTEDQKTGILRLFGVLNAESIKRRLKLDFTDLYKSGVGYDTFTAKASMDQGLLTLTKPLVIDGPSGKYTINGRSDLANKGLDLDMLAELPFSQNVPLAALVLGAPQIGGLVWVADKLLGEPLSALTTSRYDISGTWDEPRIELEQAMNASKKDRTQDRGKRNLGRPH